MEMGKRAREYVFGRERGGDKREGKGNSWVFVARGKSEVPVRHPTGHSTWPTSSPGRTEGQKMNVWQWRAYGTEACQRGDEGKGLRHPCVSDNKGRPCKVNVS